MERSFLSDRRPQLEDYDAIDRAMLDCFSEPEQTDSMDYIASQPFISMNGMNDLYGNQSQQQQQQQQRGFPYGNKEAPRKHGALNGINLGMQASQSQTSASGYNMNNMSNMQYPSQSSLTECQSMTSSSSEQSLCLANLIRNPSQTSFKMENMTSNSNNSSNKRKLSAINFNSETTLSEALPTKSELKSQHVIVSKERRRERNKFLARKTRVKKKAEVESLWIQVSQLRTENERLKEAVRLSNPKTTENILLNCDFDLPKNVVDLLDRMMAQECPPGMTKSSLRSFCITNATAPDGPIVYASPDFVELTGYEMHSILGHNCRFLQGVDTDRNELNRLKRAIEEGREETVILKNYRRDGTPFWNRTHVSPLRDDMGLVTLIVGVQTEVYWSNNAESFTTIIPQSLSGDTRHSCHGSTTGGSDSNGSSSSFNGNNHTSSTGGSSEDGTTDGTNDNDEDSNNGSTNGSEV